MDQYHSNPAYMENQRNSNSPSKDQYGNFQQPIDQRYLYENSRPSFQQQQGGSPYNGHDSVLQMPSALPSLTMPSAQNGQPMQQGQYQQQLGVPFQEQQMGYGQSPSYGYNGASNQQQGFMMSPHNGEPGGHSMEVNFPGQQQYGNMPQPVYPGQQYASPQRRSSPGQTNNFASQGGGQQQGNNFQLNSWNASEEMQRRSQREEGGSFNQWTNPQQWGPNDGGKGMGKKMGKKGGHNMGEMGGPKNAGQGKHHGQKKGGNFFDHSPRGKNSKGHQMPEYNNSPANFQQGKQKYGHTKGHANPNPNPPQSFKGQKNPQGQAGKNGQKGSKPNDETLQAMKRRQQAGSQFLEEFRGNRREFLQTEFGPNIDFEMELSNLTMQTQQNADVVTPNMRTSETSVNTPGAKGNQDLKNNSITYGGNTTMIASHKESKESMVTKKANPIVKKHLTNLIQSGWFQNLLNDGERFHEMTIDPDGSVLLMQLFENITGEDGLDWARDGMVGLLCRSKAEVMGFADSTNNQEPETPEATVKQQSKNNLSFGGFLSTDMFSSMLIGKIFEGGSLATLEHKKRLLDTFGPSMIYLTTNEFGCRVVQKAIEHCGTEERVGICHQLKNHILYCVEDSNGNHVIQKLLEQLDTDHVIPILEAFKGNVRRMAMHSYGSRVLQRIVEFCSGERAVAIYDEIHPHLSVLIHDQFGNYVVQNLIEYARAIDRKLVFDLIQQNLVSVSCHKYSSNLVEKLLMQGTDEERNSCIDIALGRLVPESKTDEETGRIMTTWKQPDNGVIQPPLLTLMRDRYANYVVQFLLKISKEERQEALVILLKQESHVLLKLAYGKHILYCLKEEYGVNIEGLHSGTPNAGKENKWVGGGKPSFNNKGTNFQDGRKGS